MASAASGASSSAAPETLPPAPGWTVERMDQVGAFAKRQCYGRRGCRCGAAHVDGLRPSIGHVVRDACGRAWLGLLLCAASAAAAAPAPSAGGPGVWSVARYALLGVVSVCVARGALAGGPLMPSRGAATAAEVRAARATGDEAARARCLARAP